MGATSRRIAAPTLAILTAVLLLVATLVGYANSALFDSNEFANRASAALDDEAVRAEIATRVTDDLVINARADLIAVRPVIESVVDGLVGGKVFQSVFRSAVRDVHRAVFRQDQNTVTLTLADVGEVLRGAIQAPSPPASWSCRRAPPASRESSTSTSHSRGTRTRASRSASSSSSPRCASFYGGATARARSSLREHHRRSAGST